MMITTMLRAQFPDRFVYPVSKVNDNLTIYFSDPTNKQTVVEVNGMRTLVDVEKKAAGNQVATVQVAAAAPAGTQGAAAGRRFQRFGRIRLRVKGRSSARTSSTFPTANRFAVENGISSSAIDSARTLTRRGWVVCSDSIVLP